MTRLLRHCLPLLCAGLMAVPYASAQNAAPAGPPPGGPPSGARVPPKPRNLKVLPENTDLRKVMREFSEALGVECQYCHTPPDPVTHRPDRASDANPMKNNARVMITMTSDLNAKYLPLLSDRMDQEAISCGTCHRGQKHPPEFVPPPRPEGNRPPAGAPPTGAPPAGAPGPGR